MGYMAWDTRTGEIIYCLPTPSGLGGPFRWDVVFEDNPDYPDFIQTRDDGPEMTTRQIKRLYRVIDGELVPKPKPILAIAESPKEDTPCEIVLDFEHLLGSDDLGAVQARFEGKGLVPVDITLQTGVNIFIFDVLGDLTLRVTDERVQEVILDLEVVPGEGY